MEENRIEVKEFDGLLKAVCWIMAAIFLLFGLLMVCIEPDKEYMGLYIFVFSTGILFFALGCMSPLFCTHTDVYTPEKMSRIKKGKTVFEILWSDVTKITYSKPVFLSWFSFGGGYAFFIHCRKEFTDKGISKGATVFHAHYKERDVYKIQRIIPVHIDM